MDALILAEHDLDFPTIPAPAEDSRTASARRFRRGLAGLALAIEWLFGLLVLLVSLSVLASIPIVQFVGFGYLLELSARVARTGRWRDGLIGVRAAARVGGMVLGVLLALVPYALIASYARSASVIDPGGPVDRGWRSALAVVGALSFLHLVLACGRGGRFRHFLWPPGGIVWAVKEARAGGWYVRFRDAFWAYWAQFRLPYYFRLGLIGMLGTLVWLTLPSFLISLGGRSPIFGVLGAVLLALVVPWLPFLQVRYAVEGRARALFEVKAVRGAWRRAPWACAFSLLVLLLAAIPLYLLKVETVPREAAWLPGLLFVGFLAPARILTGWAYARSGRRDRPRHWFFRIVGRAAVLPTAILYVVIVLLAQYTTWGGPATLYQQHAFLLPAPALGP